MKSRRACCLASLVAEKIVIAYMFRPHRSSEVQSLTTSHPIHYTNVQRGCRSNLLLSVSFRLF